MMKSAKRLISMLGLLLLGLVPAGAQEGGCKPYTQKTFPLGTVWWKPDPARAAGESHPDARAEYLVIGVHPDGILIQNKESRSPRLLGWAIVARAFVSLDGRRSWQRGCQR